MTTPHRPSGVPLATTGALLALHALAGLAAASVVPHNLDHVGVRTPMNAGGFAPEGYLRFRREALANVSPNGSGEERTGWTDARHPSLSGGRDAFLGYDRSDRFFRVANNTVTDGTAAPAGPLTANPSIPRDYDFANRVWAQSGVSILSVQERNVVEAGVTFPLNLAERNTVRGNNRAGAGIINNWYAGSHDPAGTRGVAIGPAGGNQSGTIIYDSAVPDTFAHEIGHFILDSRAVHNEDPGDTAHSLDPFNLMADGGIRRFPGQPMGDLGGGQPAWAIANDLAVVGRPLSTNPNGSPRVGGVDRVEISQTNRVFTAANVAPFLTNNVNTAAGDRADFRWVEDNITLELGRQAGADNHPGAADFMVWEIGDIAVSNNTAPDAANGGQDLPADALNLDRFRGNAFNYVDVFSQICRYADSDLFFAGTDISRRESSLDYYVQFSTDGQNWFDGVAVQVFVFGWTVQSAADDYLARWMVPGNLPNGATFVRIGADPLSDSRDGNAQIDAIVAGQIPTPGPVALAALGTLAALRRRRR
ncbi:MAG: hypothetical protein JNK35_01085 [Phycisphaerae bacterium]|nr:hypothetical protein [Phycisphaerae bacterium]